MKKLFKRMMILSGVLVLALALAAPALAAPAPEGEPAAQTQEDNTIGLKALAAGIAVGVAAA